MNKRNNWIVTSIFVIGAMFVPADFLERALSTETQADDSDIILLEGLKAVRVQVVQPVSGFEDKPKFNPVNIDSLQADIKETLYQACIETGDGSLNDTEIGYIVVTVNVWKDLVFAKYLVQVKTELYQLAELSRDTRLRIMVPTWPTGEELSDVETPMLVTSAGLAGKVQEAVQRQIGMFIEDFLEANPSLKQKMDLVNMMTGTIKYVAIEGGFFGIYGDNGKRYRPVNLSREYRKDGLHVAFQIKKIRAASGPNIFMWGESVRIVEIWQITK